MVAPLLENITIKTKHEAVFWIYFYKMMFTLFCELREFIQKAQESHNSSGLCYIFLCT